MSYDGGDLFGSRLFFRIFGHAILNINSCDLCLITVCIRLHVDPYVLNRIILSLQSLFNFTPSVKMLIYLDLDFFRVFGHAILNINGCDLCVVCVVVYTRGFLCTKLCNFNFAIII